LDLGCGAGNNAKFLAENGFDVYGIDGSETAVKICEERFRKWGLKAHFIRGDFLSLPYKNDFFDLIVDRESLCANRTVHIKKIIDDIFRKLKPAGFFISFMFNEFHPNKSSFRGTGRVHLANMEEILGWLSNFKIENIARHSLTGLFDEYIIIVKK